MRDIVHNRSVLIVGHADGDGYLAAEQSRRNAVGGGAARCDVLADPAVTPGYRFWERHLPQLNVADYDVVVFVDLMFNYHSPMDSFDRVRAAAGRESERQFLVIDHHEVRGLPETPSNLQLRFTATVYECCLGEPSDLMVVAAICDRDEAPVLARITETHRRRALGVTRAAADRAGLAGEPLLRMLREDRWDIIEALGQEDRRLHRSVRGVRPRRDPASPALQAARACA